ncbi:hypothetical protein D3C85_1023190 [compost metagenome]
MLGRIEEGPAPGGQQHLARLAARPRDPLGEGLGQQQARIRLAAVTAARRPRPALGQLDRIPRTRRTVPLQPLQTVVQIDGVAAQSRLAQHRRNLRAAKGVILIRGHGDHVRQSRRQRNPRQPPPVRRQVALGVQRAQPGQNLPRLGQRPGGRRVQQGQTFN